MVTGFLGPNGAGKSTTMRMILGLDPEGIIWIRTFIRSLAAEGRTVLVSSHLMSEMAQTADHLLVIGRGRMIADMPMSELMARQGALRQPEALPSVRSSGLSWLSGEYRERCEAYLWPELSRLSRRSFHAMHPAA